MPATTSARTDAASTRGRLTARDLALVASVAGLIAVLGIPGPLFLFSAIAPITLQSLGIMLAGALLGWKRGTLAVLLFLALAAVGLPVLAGGRGGLGVFVGPTAGYLAGYVAGAFVTGWIVQQRARRLSSWWIALACIVGGIGAVHLFGVPGLMWRGGLELQPALVTAAGFVPGDLLKVVAATIVVAGVHRAIPTLLPSTWAGRRR